MTLRPWAMLQRSTSPCMHKIESARPDALAPQSCLRRAPVGGERPCRLLLTVWTGYSVVVDGQPQQQRQGQQKTTIKTSTMAFKALQGRQMTSVQQPITTGQLRQVNRSKATQKRVPGVVAMQSDSNSTSMRAVQQVYNFLQGCSAELSWQSCTSWNCRVASACALTRIPCGVLNLRGS